MTTSRPPATTALLVLKEKLFSLAGERGSSCHARALGSKAKVCAPTSYSSMPVPNTTMGPPSNAAPGPILLHIPVGSTFVHAVGVDRTNAVPKLSTNAAPEPVAIATGGLHPALQGMSTVSNVQSSRFGL